MKGGLLEHSEILSYWDLILGPIYLIVLSFIVYKFIQRYEHLTIQKYCLPAFGLKVIGGITASIVYQFYFEAGDYNGYYYGASLIYNNLAANPALSWELFNTSFDQFSDQAILLHEQVPKAQFHCSPCRVVISIGSLLSLITFNSYISIALVLAFFSFLGSWKLFQVFYELYPRQHLLIALAVLFLPSVIFWGSSGLTKDTIVMTTVSFLVWSTYTLFIKRRFQVYILGLLLLSLFLLIKIKIYVAIILIPSLLVWLALHYFTKIKKTGFKLGFVLVAFMAILVSTQLVALYNPSFSFKNIIHTAIHAQQYNKKLSENFSAESVFEIGMLDNKWTSLTLIPKAINVTFFRPYLWETKKLTVLPFAIESLFFLLFTFYTFYKVKFRTLLKTLSTDPTFSFCLIFSLLFATGIGMTAYNFGTLTRYKIPCISFYLLSLIILLNEEFALRQVSKDSSVQIAGGKDNSPNG